MRGDNVCVNEGDELKKVKARSETTRSVQKQCNARWVEEEKGASNVKLLK
jgi:hypothetical protein